MNFNWLDIVLLAVLIITFILGIAKGLIRQIIGIVAVIIGLILAVHYYAYFSQFYWRLISHRTLSHLLGFFTVFIAVLCIGWLTAYWFSKLMKGPLKFLNHAAGGALGLVKGILICGVTVFALLIFPVNKKVLKESELAPYCLEITRAAYYLIPESLKQQFQEAYEDILGKRRRYEKRI
ncbi:MAG: CvpA family protein [Candidatus Aminicenantes bacterium]